MSGSFWDGVTPQAVQNAKDGFTHFQIGENVAFIDQVNATTSKNSGKKMLDIIFKNAEGAEVHYYIVDDEYKLQKIKGLQMSFGIPYGNNEIDTTWKGKRGIVVCKEEEYNGNKYPKVSYLKPILASDKANSKQPEYMDNVGDAGQGSNVGFTDDIPF